MLGPRSLGTRGRDVVRERLLTPVGLRSLHADHPDYKARYAATCVRVTQPIHQGTVWAWMIGPFVDAWLRAHPGDRAPSAGSRASRDISKRGRGPARSARSSTERPLHFPVAAWPGVERGRVAEGWLKCQDIAGIGLAAQYRKLAGEGPQTGDRRTIMTGLVPRPGQSGARTRNADQSRLTAVTRSAC